MPARESASTPATTEFLRIPEAFEQRPTEVVRSPAAPPPPAPAPAPTPVQHMTPRQEPSEETGVLRQKYWSERRAEIAVVVSVVAVLAALISLYATGLWLKWWALPR